MTDKDFLPSFSNIFFNTNRRLMFNKRKDNLFHFLDFIYMKLECLNTKDVYVDLDLKNIYPSFFYFYEIEV